MNAPGDRTTRRGRAAPEDYLLGGVLCLALAALASWWLWDGEIADFFRVSEKLSSRNRWLLAFGELGRPEAAFWWLLLFWAWAVKRPRLILAALLAVALVGATVQPMKMFVGRVRPDQNAEVESKKPFYRRSASFPSGDAATAFAVATVACAFVGGGGRGIAFLLAAIVALTRLCLMRHYLSDVCMGAAVGLLCGYFALRISSAWLSRAPPWLQWVARPPRWWRPASGAALALYLVADALLRGPLTRRFLPVFAPVILLVLLAAKGRAWLRWARRGARKRASDI